MIGIASKGKSCLLAAVTVLLLSSCSSRSPDSDFDTGAAVGGSYGHSAGLGASGSNDGYDVEPTSSVYAYRSNSPYANVLKSCILITEREDSCKLNKLPFIGDGRTTPTFDDIMDRVLVTHNWMGERFEDMLRVAPPEVITMFASSTAILIGSNVRPSFYTSLSASIQIDPVYLWSTLEEKRSISTQEDFRSSYGSDLQFWFLSRTAKKNGSRLTPYYTLADDTERPIADIKLPLMRLLIHELTHATDFMPRQFLKDINDNLSAYDAIGSLQNDWLSPVLYTSHPLASTQLEALAGVRFRGLAANAAQKSMNAGDVGRLMGTDGAAQFYSYTTMREDIAQLVESVLMSVRYDTITNIGFTQKPEDLENYTCADLLVSWGQRNRLADPLVNDRARKAIDLVVGMTPEISDYLTVSLGFSEEMESMISWCDNQTTTAALMTDSVSVSRSRAQASMPESGSMFREMIRQDSTLHPAHLEHR